MRHWAPPFRLVLNMIIVSESSTKATQPVGTGRYTLTHSHSSASHSDTHRHADIKQISVHIEEVIPIHFAPALSAFDANPLVAACPKEGRDYYFLPV